MSTGPLLVAREPTLSLAEEDAYVNLLSRTRNLRREQRHLRDQWFAKLPADSREELLFELEVLLKATACFANPRNHPGPHRRTPIVAQDFRESTLLFREGTQRAVDLCRQLLGARDRAFVFHRYLETVLPEDNVRARLLREGIRQQTPEDSLVALRHALTSAVEVADGILRAPRVPFRLFYAVLAMVQREVGQNAFFNPLIALEFRPEFDRIQSPEVLNLIRRAPQGQAHRLVALTFLSLFRMLRYVQLLGRIIGEGGKRSHAAGRIYFVLSVLRSDARALSDYLTKRVGILLAESFRTDIYRHSASEIVQHGAALRAEAHHLLSVKGALEGIAANLRLEMRRAYQHDLPAPDSGPSDRGLRQTTAVAIANLRPALRNAILFLGKALGVTLEETGVFDDDAARRETSERLRRDVWMFAQIVRAFYTKAQHSAPDDRWNTVHSFHYVREFLGYFRSMGYPLLRAADYSRVDDFLGALGRIEDTDLVDPKRLKTAIDECVAFHQYLLDLFQEISKRDVLEGAEFNRRAAAGALKLYLGESARY